MNIDVAIQYSKKNDETTCEKCKKGFKVNAIKICQNPPFDFKASHRLSSRIPAPNVNNINRIYTHLKCVEPAQINPCQCMFFETINSLQAPDVEKITSVISNWQKKNSKLRDLKKSLTRIEYESDADKENVDSQTKLTPAKRKSEKNGKKVKRRKLMQNKWDASSTVAPTYDDPVDATSLEQEEREDPFLLELSRDVWFNGT
jgi:hypothetical protein